MLFRVCFCKCRAANWWVRSPNRDNSNNFCCVNNNGDANNDNASNSNGVAPISYQVTGQESNFGEMHPL